MTHDFNHDTQETGKGEPDRRGLGPPKTLSQEEESIVALPVSWAIVSPCKLGEIQGLHASWTMLPWQTGTGYAWACPSQTSGPVPAGRLANYVLGFIALAGT